MSAVAASGVVPVVRTDAPRPARPYVGPRPFARHEASLLYGRDQDTKLLVDKVFSERLTVFYGQSGLGKSSLLRALVVPELEAGGDAAVVYFDAWAGERPEDALKAALGERAAELGIRDALRGAPTLAELARLINAAHGRTVIVVLDQFEEFLIVHGRRLDPLRSELAELIRAPGLDVRVLLALREESLAALEPFRAQIVSLFSSTYRLEPLDEKALRDAVVEPARVFGKSIEPGLVDALLADLSPRPESANPSAALVPLSFLQLVCDRLWTAMERDQLPLNLATYHDKLGAAERILKDYVRSAMPRNRRDQLFTASCASPGSQ